MTTSVGGYNVGKDCTINLVVVGTGQSFTMPETTELNFDAKTTTKTILPVNGNPQHCVFMEGYTGTMSGERKNRDMDDLWQLLEACYFNATPVPPMYYHVTVRETDGSVTDVIYTDVQLEAFKTGALKGNDTISWSVGILASRREVTP
jgi:hypothetical protein